MFVDPHVLRVRCNPPVDAETSVWHNQTSSVASKPLVATTDEVCSPDTKSWYMLDMVPLTHPTVSCECIQNSTGAWERSLARTNTCSRGETNVLL